jgi:hypothetical protein
MPKPWSWEITMRLGGRLQAAIEVLSEIETRHRPVPDALKDWGLSHRFAGSGDRAAISNLVHDALRMKLSHGFIMGGDTPADLAVATLLRQWRISPKELTATLEGDRFAPEIPSAEKLADCLARDLAHAPAHVRADIPEWLTGSFERAFGNGMGARGPGADSPAAAGSQGQHASFQPGSGPVRLFPTGLPNQRSLRRSVSGLKPAKDPCARSLPQAKSALPAAGLKSRTRARNWRPDWSTPILAKMCSIIAPAAAASPWPLRR